MDAEAPLSVTGGMLLIWKCLPPSREEDKESMNANDASAFLIKTSLQMLYLEI